MDEEQKEWQKQFWTNFGATEYIRFSCSFGLWMFLAVALALTLSLVFNIPEIVGGFLITTFLIAAFTFSIVSRTWRPAYNILRKILGNKDLPTEPIPHSTIKIPRQPLPWYGYLPGIWGWLMGLALLYVIIKYLSTK